jgi:hypothetical protein
VYVRVQQVVRTSGCAVYRPNPDGSDPRYADSLEHSKRNNINTDTLGTPRPEFGGRRTWRISAAPGKSSARSVLLRFSVSLLKNIH